MEEAKRDEKKKGNAYDVPSCLLSPDSPGDHIFGRSTPISDASSASCFLTPPPSSEKDVNSRTRLDTLQDLTKLNFELDDGDHESSKQKSSQRTPLQPEDRIMIIERRCEEIRLDIISELLAYNLTPICENICSYLKPQDLYRFVRGICLIPQTQYAIVFVSSLRTSNASCCRLNLISGCYGLWVWHLLSSIETKPKKKEGIKLADIILT